MPSSGMQPHSQSWSLGLGLVLSSSWLEERGARRGSQTLDHEAWNPHVLIRRDCMPFFQDMTQHTSCSPLLSFKIASEPWTPYNSSHGLFSPHKNSPGKYNPKESRNPSVAMSHTNIVLDASTLSVLGHVLGLGPVLSGAWLEEHGARDGPQRLDHVVWHPDFLIRRHCMPSSKISRTCNS